MVMASVSLSAQSNKPKQKYPQTKVFRGDTIVILTIEQSEQINKTFKEQTAALDSFRVLTDTLIQYKDSVTMKYVTTDSILLVTDSLKRELEAYKLKVEEAAKQGLYVTYDKQKQQAKFLPFDNKFKVLVRETSNGVTIYASNVSQYTKTRIAVGSGLALLTGMAFGLNSEIAFHPAEIRNTFPNWKQSNWDHFGYYGPGTWDKSKTVGPVTIKTDMWHTNKTIGNAAIAVAFPITYYDTKTWKQIITRSLILSASYTLGYNTMTRWIVK
jgi:hypothetical protein